MEQLDAESAVIAGGWDARFAVAVAVATHGDIAAALIDTNGDGADINLDEYRRTQAGAWIAGNSGVASPTSWSQEMVTAHGRATPGTTVQLEYNGAEYAATANRSGWWLFIAPPADQQSLVHVIVD